MNVLNLLLLKQVAKQSFIYTEHNYLNLWAWFIWSSGFSKDKIWYMQSFMCTIKMSLMINDFYITNNDDWFCCTCTLLTCTSDEGMLLKVCIGSFRVEGMSVFLNNSVFCSYYMVSSEGKFSCLYCMISLRDKFSCLYCMISFKFSEHCVVNAAAFASAEGCDRVPENWLLIDGIKNWFSGWRQATQELSFQKLLKNTWKMFLLKEK